VPVVDRILPIRPAFLRTAVSVALIAQLVSLPILLTHFFQFSPYSFFLNVFLVPLYSLVYIPAAFLVTLVSFVHIELVQLAVYVYERSFMWIQDGLRDVHRLSGAVVHTGPPPVWWICVYAVIVCVWLWGMERRRRILVWVPITVLPLLVVGLLCLPYMDRHAYITMLDVGQAEAIVVELPYRQEVLLIDAGAEVRFSEQGWQVQSRTFEAGKDVIVPYLRYRGINRIDKAVLSHPHYDHAAGLTAVIDHVDVKAVYRSPTVPQAEWEFSFMEELEDRDVPVYVLGRGDAWEHDHASFHVLFPEGEDGLVEHVTNVHDYNIVLYNRIYDTTFLWTGDLEETGEMEILAEYEQLTADVLKIGHHGSQTSTSFPFVSQLQPVASLVSVGSYNRYGHPHPEVTERLETEGVPVWRTDQDGGVQIIVNQQGFRVVPTLQGSG
jgi:competence protein ComEC